MLFLFVLHFHDKTEIRSYKHTEADPENTMLKKNSCIIEKKIWKWLIKIES